MYYDPYYFLSQWQYQYPYSYSRTYTYEECMKSCQAGGGTFESCNSACKQLILSGPYYWYSWYYPYSIPTVASPYNYTYEQCMNDCQTGPNGGTSEECHPVCKGFLE